MHKSVVPGSRARGSMSTHAAAGRCPLSRRPQMIGLPVDGERGLEPQVHLQQPYLSSWTLATAMHAFARGRSPAQLLQLRALPCPCRTDRPPASQVVPGPLPCPRQRGRPPASQEGPASLGSRYPCPKGFRSRCVRRTATRDGTAGYHLHTAARPCQRRRTVQVAQEAGWMGATLACAEGGDHQLVGPALRSRTSQLRPRHPGAATLAGHRSVPVVRPHLGHADFGAAARPAAHLHSTVLRCEHQTLHSQYCGYLVKRASLDACSTY
mmetsp:Transcript_18913/g.53372  ORF Transcript_18913/g.53372 Transcript_18913/m.53372 type:complete len:267 (+) Transcript_18913:110-910(+)